MTEPRARARTDFRPCARRSQIQGQAVRGNFDADVWEFIQAVRKAERQVGRPLRTHELFEVVWGLGYRVPADH